MDIKSIQNFIKKQNVTFICSVDEDGFPNVKAMLKPRKIEGNDYYFTTNTSSMRVRQYRINSNAALYFYCKKLFIFTGVMLKGKMEVLENQDIKDEIWKKGRYVIL